MEKQVFLTVALFCLAFFGAMTTAQLWPHEGEPVLVAFDDDLTQEAVLNSLISADAVIIEKVSSHRFVLDDADPETGDFFGRLGDAGVWLILNGAAGYGCSSDRQRSVFSRDEFLVDKSA